MQPLRVIMVRFKKKKNLIPHSPLPSCQLHDGMPGKSKGVRSFFFTRFPSQNGRQIFESSLRHIPLCLQTLGCSQAWSYYVHLPSCILEVHLEVLTFVLQWDEAQKGCQLCCHASNPLNAYTLVVHQPRKSQKSAS